MSTEKERRNENGSSEQKRKETLQKTAFAGVFAAVTYVVFTFLAIRIPTPGSGQVSVHLGNAFVILGALLLGSLYGGLGGAVGLTIADLIDPVYIVEAPITFVIKLLMGVITGVIAHRIGHITHETDPKKVFRWMMIAAAAGLAFNAVFDPFLRYLYKILILGKPAAEVSFAINLVVTVINSAVSIAIVAALYMGLRTALKKVGLFFKL